MDGRREDNKQRKQHLVLHENIANCTSLPIPELTQTASGKASLDSINGKGGHLKQIYETNTDRSTGGHRRSTTH